MVGIKFDNKHSYDDYGLILSSKSIGTPTVKKQTIAIAGADGVLDLTDFFGEPKFNNRELSFEFTKVHTTLAAFNDDWTTLQNEFGGQKFKITIDEDSDFYYTGRIALKHKRSKNITTFTFTCDCEPYKLKNEPTVVAISGSETVVLSNLRKRVVPTIKTTGETTFTFGNHVVNVSAGTYVFPELELKAGNTEVSVEGSGTTTFTYQEGGL